MTYAEKLLDPRWQKKRLSILDRDNWCCQLCYDSEITLHVHHISYTGKNPWDSPDDQLMTVCKHCHAVIEYNKSELISKHIRVLKRYFSNDLTGLTFIYLDNLDEVYIDIYHYNNRNELEYKTTLTQEHLIDIKENIEYYHLKAEAP
jgi:hypothetical protein